MRSALILSLLLASPAAAQSLQAPTREELEIAAPPATDRAPAPRVRVESDLERGPCPLADPAYDTVSVRFDRVDFAGSGPVSAAELEPTWREFAGREVPIASLCTVRDRAATLLRAQGYLAAVQIPPQRIEPGGTVRMDVLLARLTEVQLRGDVGRAAKRIAAHVAKLRAREYFSIRDAERHLLLLGDLPGFDVRLTLRPAEKPGEIFGDLYVARRPLEVVGGVQNLGSREAGRYGAFVQATFNDVTGLGDRTEISAFNTAELHEQTVVRIGHDLALGSQGWRLAAGLTYGRSERRAEDVSITSDAIIGRIEASYPLVRRQALTLRAAAGMEIVDQRLEFAGIRLSEDRLRVLFARAELDLTDKASLGKRPGYSDSEPFWRLGAVVEARQGTGLFGASHDCRPIARCAAVAAPISNLVADPRAFLLRLEAVAEFRPKPGVTVVLAPRAQYTASALLAFEQFSLGNYTIGRGFDPGVVQGDSGAGVSLELRFGRRKYQQSGSFRFLPYVFADAAWAWTNDEGAPRDPRRALSAGAGVRVPWRDRIEANLALAFPLERAGAQTRRGDVRLQFTLAARLAPWKE